MKGSDVAANDVHKWVLIYLGTGTGTQTGEQYTSQTPALPFSANYHVRWKTNNSYTGVQTSSGGAWADASWNLGSGDVYQKNDVVEFRIPLSKIGATSGSSIKVHMSMINEATVPASEWTFAGMPSTSFTDSKNPAYTKYYAFTMGGASAPTSYSVKP
jgi:hypothetical protein